MGMGSGQTTNAATQQATEQAQANAQEQAMQTQLQQESAQQAQQYAQQTSLLENALFANNSSSNAPPSAQTANLPNLGALVGVASPGGSYLSNGTTRASFLGD
jgi:hypothetical protein